MNVELRVEIIRGTIIIGAIHKGNSVGHVYFVNIENKSYKLRGLLVNPEYRRKNIATKLINEGKKYADKISLVCYQRLYLIDLYHKCNFQIVGVCHTESNDPQTNRLQITMLWERGEQNENINIGEKSS